jgi:hypothetical protein
MKILLALLALVPSQALSSPSLPEAGTYTFQDFTVMQLRRAEVVRTNTEAGRARLEQLRAAGGECVARGPELVRCVSFEKTAGSEEEIAKEVNREMRSARLIFGEPEGVPSETVTSPTYEEWMVPQPVKFFGQAWPNFRIMRLRGELEKFVFGNPTQFGVVVGPRGLGYVFNLPRQLNRDVTLTYLVEARFQRSF